MDVDELSEEEALSSFPSLPFIVSCNSGSLLIFARGPRVHWSLFDEPLPCAVEDNSCSGWCGAGKLYAPPLRQNPGRLSFPSLSSPALLLPHTRFFRDKSLLIDLAILENLPVSQRVYYLIPFGERDTTRA